MAIVGRITLDYYTVIKRYFIFRNQREVQKVFLEVFFSLSMCSENGILKFLYILAWIYSKTWRRDNATLHTASYINDVESFQPLPT